MSPFAELVAASNFSFLRGASQAAGLVGQAIALGLGGIGIADRNTVAGVVRAHAAIKREREDGALPATFRLAVGARLVFADDTPDLVAYPATRQGWGRLTRLLTTGNRRAVKGECTLHWQDLVDHIVDIPGEMLLIAMEGDTAMLRQLAELAPESLWRAATMPRAGDDARRLEALMALSRETGVPLLATNDVLYALAEDRPLHDVMTCIREGTTIETAGKRLLANGERHLKAPEEMTRLFAACPEAITASGDLLARIDFTLDDLRYEYPHEPVPEGWHSQDWLEQLVLKAAKMHYGYPFPPKVQAVLDEEFRLIRDRNYAYYFLTVHDLVQFARAQDPPILCQGRGSAANSIVCYLLEITGVDPIANKLLFSRFLSENRNEPPDIDVDFEHERREEVMQYVYRRYGRERAGIVATVIHYRQRSAIREVGKVLGLSEDITARLSGTIWGSWGGEELPEARLEQAGFQPGNPVMARVRDMVGRILEFPRHLSQHVGGFVLTEGRLDELVPIHNAAMPDRTFIEWDKDDIDTLGLMKVDVLALGMLTCIRKSFDLMRQHDLDDHDLKSVPPDDEATYKMLQKGDSIGVFQVESRAQINMLPRLKPQCLYDLVIQVAIVRPGPIQGDMVHPYLRRRTDKEKVEFPSPAPPHDPQELVEVLGRTLGVPLFQEQAMSLAIVAAGFSPKEADGLRRAMATFRRNGTIQHYEDKLINGMVQRGYQREFAQRCFNQIKGFGDYGFPESHAQSFAYLAYVSSWLKCHHPAVFTCALLNSQPMGFYAPAQLVRDLREHGGTVLPIDVSRSVWDNSLERVDGSLALRLGFRQIDGFREDWAARIVEERPKAAFSDIQDLVRRTLLPQRGMRLLADADAFAGLGTTRRDALWEARRTPSGELPLFAWAEAAELKAETDPPLPAMPLAEEVVADYQTHRLSLKGHPMQFLREHFRARGVISCADANAAKDDARIQCAGVVLIRQRPGKGNAIFITLEDETGIANALLWARDFEKQREAVMAARLMRVEAVVQRSEEGVVHLMAARCHDDSACLALLDEQPIKPDLCRPDSILHPDYGPQGTGNRFRHPRQVRILPKSRDFH